MKREESGFREVLRTYLRELHFYRADGHEHGLMAAETRSNCAGDGRYATHPRGRMEQVQILIVAFLLFSS